MLKRILPARPEHVAFLLTECEVGLTFGTQALAVPVGTEPRQHYLRNAQRCLDTVMRFRSRVHLSDDDNVRLEAVLGPLCDLVERLTVGRPFMVNDPRVFLIERGTAWSVQRGGEMLGLYTSLADATVAGATIAFEHRTDLLRQDSGTWVTVRSYLPIGPGPRA